MAAADRIAVLGLGGSDHDVHACLAVDEAVAVFIEDERISRKKYGLGGNLLEGLSRRYCLEAGGLGLDDVGAVLRDDILAAPAYFPCRSRARRVDHHLCHAATAFHTSAFERAGILVVDNAGGLFRDDDGRDKLQATSWYLGEGRRIELLGRVGSTDWTDGPLFAGEPYQRGDGDHSIGHFYKKLSGALGFRFPRTAGRADFFFPEDGITMGLAAYGSLDVADRLADLFRLEADGRYAVTLTDGRIDALLDDLLPEGSDFARMADVAAAGQEVLTRVMCHLVEHLVDATGETRICLGGGVAMNSSTNGEILKRTRATALHVPFAPGDNGTGLGAVLLEAAADADRPIPAASVYGGRRYGEAAIDAALARVATTRYAVDRPDEAALVEEVVQRLCDQQVVALFQGGSEGGRRALGHRSLLADPRRWAMRDHINHAVKRREFFRPFAPVVLAQDAGRYFETDQPSPFMQIVFGVRPEHRDSLGAVNHVDNSARIQTLEPGQVPRLEAFIRGFGARTGIPVLLNTSFNGPGEPMVETPGHAVAAMDRLGVDALVLEDRLVVRR